MELVAPSHTAIATSTTFTALRMEGRRRTAIVAQGTRAWAGGEVAQDGTEVGEDAEDADGGIEGVLDLVHGLVEGPERRPEDLVHVDEVGLAVVAEADDVRHAPTPPGPQPDFDPLQE